MQDASFAIGQRFLTLLPRQAEIARRAIEGGGFSEPARQSASTGQSATALPWFDSTKSRQFGWNVWASGFGGRLSQDGDGRARSTRQTVSFAAVASGVDYRLTPNLLIGAAMGFGFGGYVVDGRTSTGNTDTALFGLYSSWARDHFYVDAALSYAHGDFATRRVIASGTPEQADGAFSGNQVGSRLEAGWRTALLAGPLVFDVTPFAALTTQRLRQSGYADVSRVAATGAPGTLGLSVANRTTWSVRSEVGVQLQSVFFIEAFQLLSPRVRLAWVHEFGTGREITAGTGSPSTTTQGAHPARNALLFSAGAVFWSSWGLHGFAQFDAEWSHSSNAYGASGGLRMSW